MLFLISHVQDSVLILAADSSSHEDCNDGDIEISPIGTEIANETDDDCEKGNFCGVLEHTTTSSSEYPSRNSYSVLQPTLQEAKNNNSNLPIIKQPVFNTREAK